MNAENKAPAKRHANTSHIDSQHVDAENKAPAKRSANTSHIDSQRRMQKARHLPRDARTHLTLAARIECRKTKRLPRDARTHLTLSARDECRKLGTCHAQASLYKSMLKKMHTATLCADKCVFKFIYRKLTSRIIVRTIYPRMQCK